MTEEDKIQLPRKTIDMSPGERGCCASHLMLNLQLKVGLDFESSVRDEYVQASCILVIVRIYTSIQALCMYRYASVDFSV